uniref:Uncharacterized protein n=1 Tax=Panagrolaimus sp. PS1159 TaxID=55785 RepID=A0AC35EUU8_9BILA
MFIVYRFFLLLVIVLLNAGLFF